MLKFYKIAENTDRFIVGTLNNFVYNINSTESFSCKMNLCGILFFKKIK